MKAELSERAKEKAATRRLPYLTYSARKMVLTLGSTSAFITNSETGKNYLQDYVRAPENQVFRIIYKPGDIKTLSQQLTTLPIVNKSQCPRFLYVGQLIPRKSVNYLLSAWSKLQSLSSHHGSLWIVGSGFQKDELVQQGQAQGLKEVNFVGQVEYTSLRSWCQACDVFILPILEDKWANVVPEAMQFEKPIICSK